jgi:nitrate/nitrite transport system substrate-binding protein
MNHSLDRRRFLGLLGGAVALPSAAALLGACGSDDTAAAPSTPDTAAAETPASEPPPSQAAAVSAAPPASEAAAAPTTLSGPARKVKLGFIALTDSAPIIMAQELGYFTARNLEVEVIKQASWPATRDALLAGEIDGAHALYSMPFSVATGVGGPGTTDLKIAMILNNNGQAITLHKDFVDVGYGDLTKAKGLLASSDAPEMAMTFPGGTHDLWLRYWLAACGVDSATLKISPVPPPQMVQNMTVGNIKGYCVGEPWNAVAIANGIGFTTLASQDLWQHHPEKALVVGTKFATEQRDVLKEVMGAILDAQKWLDDMANRAAAADTLGQEKFVNAPAADILGRLTGKYDFGLGVGTKDFAGDQMQFFRDGMTPFPRRSYGVWALSQYARLGLMPAEPDYMKLVDDIILTDLFAEVSAAAGIDVPDDDMAPFEVKLDSVTFDPTKPGEEVARGFAS